MMESQRTIQATRPKAERVNIGGEIIVHHLTHQRFTIYVLDEFEDCEANERAIYEISISADLPFYCCRSRRTHPIR